MFLQRSPRLSRYLMALSVFGLLLGSAPAAAQSAKALLAKANKLFAAGDYKAAYDAFKAGSAKAPKSPAFVRGMADCQLKLRRYGEALKLFERYQQHKRAKDRAKIKQMIARLKQVIATKVEVVSTPPGAEIYVDLEAKGQLGVTPRTLSIEPGTHTVILKKSGFRLASKTFNINSGQRLKVDVTLEVPVKITSAPSGATVHRGSPDAPAMGKTPLDTGLPEGQHKIFVKAGGYQTFSRTLAVSAASPPQPLHAALALGFTIKSQPAGAQVLLDGQAQQGQTPLSVAATPGAHRVTLKLAGFKDFEQTVNVQPGQDASFTAQLRGGLLSMRTSSPGARVKVDGVEVGTTPLEAVPVPMGKKKVTVLKPGRTEWSKEIAFTDNELITGKLKLGRPSWPFWTMLGVGVVSGVVATILGVGVLKDASDAKEKPYYDSKEDAKNGDNSLGSGWCSGYRDPAGEGVYGVDPNNTNEAFLITKNTCGGFKGQAPLATTMVVTAITAGVGALAYYLFGMRSSESIERKPRGEAEAAPAASRRPPKVKRTAAYRR